MNLKNIKDKLKNIKPKPIDFDVSFAVLVPIIEIDGELNLIFEVRSNSITQPGEISFPGGRIEEGESPRKAAIRETSEELLLNKENIEIISELNYASSKSGAFVFTFLGLIKDVDPDEIEYSIDEVSEVFFVPLSFFLENRPEKYYMNYYPKADKDFPYHMVNNGEDYNWGNIRYPVYFYKYYNYIIWGLTAKITYSLIKELTNSDVKKRNNNES
ncbi:MAG TPA: CoA pyrophosphatase [Sedimentibacter sp.]|jgi:coenzyme A diphosphatase NUDT7|nr:CoA pyrophosphatase [Sedimentibacter sp.]HOA20589.1 CoA pyrophosphatase [Sedimentibacter sp.]HOG63518.1 CoA pyrophosphatase [Sedimentibacter sp.]HOT21592.1 CoA pyrophosphatase [Sedimentibacter sp.]HPB79222.1 CoA pyrophosphatase [Sedimentibacter sp.]